MNTGKTKRTRNPSLKAIENSIIEMGDTELEDSCIEEKDEAFPPSSQQDLSQLLSLTQDSQLSLSQISLSQLISLTQNDQKDNKAIVKCDGCNTDSKTTICFKCDHCKGNKCINCENITVEEIEEKTILEAINLLVEKLPIFERLK